MDLISFRGKSPKLSPRAWAAGSAVAIGDVMVDAEAALWYGAVLRGDNAPITVGEGTNVQDNAVIHVSPGCPTAIGRHVSVGHGAIVHGCTIGDECIIGMGAILLNNCVIGKGCMVAAGALVTQGKEIPPYSLVVGSPAKVVRPLTEAEREAGMESAREYLELAREGLPPVGDGQ